MSLCKQVRNLLALRSVDLDLDEQKLVETHLATCPDCAALVSHYAEQDRLIRNRPYVYLTPSQRNQLFSQIQQERKRYKMSTRLSIVWSSFMAVVVIAALGLGVKILIPWPGQSGQDIRPGQYPPTPTTLSPTSTPLPTSTPSDTLPHSETVFTLIWPIGEFSAKGEPISSPQTRVKTTFGQQIELYGFDSTLEAASFEFVVYWQSLTRLQTDYMFFVHVYDSQGGLAAQADIPVDTLLEGATADSGEKDEPIKSVMSIPLEQLKPGKYEAMLGVYNSVTGQRLPTTDSPDDMVFLTSFEVGASTEQEASPLAQSYTLEHQALDIAAPKGMPVVAAAAGQVFVAQWDSEGYGNYVIIDHHNGVRTFYSHLLDYQVQPGDEVTAGQQIGRVGSTGNSTGPHLHFELLQNIDPLPLLPDK